MHTVAYVIRRQPGGRRRLSGLPQPVLQDYVLSHSLGTLLTRNASGGAAALYAVGGVHDPDVDTKRVCVGRTRSGCRDLRTADAHLRPADGVSSIHADRLSDIITRAWHPDTAELQPAQTRHNLLDGHHSGCLERYYFRFDRTYICRYDGKLSLAQLGSRYLIFARSNLKEQGGGRFLQVASSASPTGSFGPFRLLQFHGYDERGPGNIYFAAVKAHPLHPTSMLMGLFPVNFGIATDEPYSKWRNGAGFLMLSHSCDGVHWSSLVPLTSTVGLHQTAGRTVDHPVDGLIVRGGDLDVFIHVNALWVNGALGKRGPASEPRLVRLRLRTRHLQRLAVQAKAQLASTCPAHP